MASKRSWTGLFKLNDQENDMQNHPIVSQVPSSYKGRPAHYDQRNPETKSRWNPKPEQIQILESIFVSGKLNPTKDEIQAIRTQLQQFGEVGDANIFYWFQNRKSRSKKRQRRLEAAAENATPIIKGSSSPVDRSTNSIAYNATTGNFIQSMAESSYPTLPSSAALFPKQSILMQPTEQIPTDQYIIQATEGGRVLSEGITAADNYSVAAMSSLRQEHSAVLLSKEQSYPFNLDHFHAPLVSSTLTGSTIIHADWSQGVGSENEVLLTVFIDGVKYQVRTGPINVKAFFGENALLVDSSGQKIVMNEGGFTFQGLQEGAAYYLLNKAGETQLAGLLDA